MHSLGIIIGNNRTMLVIPCKRLGASERDLLADWKTVLFRNCWSFSPPSLKVSSKATEDFRKPGKNYNGKLSKVKQSKVKEWDVSSSCKTANDESIRCFNERLVGAFPNGTEQRDLGQN